MIADDAGTGVGPSGSSVIAASRTLIDRKRLLEMIPLSERTIFDMEQRGEFPRRICLTVRRVAWDLAEVLEWIAERRAIAAPATRPGFVQLVQGGR